MLVVGADSAEAASGAGSCGANGNWHEGQVTVCPGESVANLDRWPQQGHSYSALFMNLAPSSKTIPDT